jgi:hypothetical protein
MKGTGHIRLVGTVRGEASRDDRSSLSFADVARQPLEQLRLDIERVHWFSTYRVYHRVASRFRVGRAFLLGDAAHVHSPVGAQGMNTGIGDAMNLAWKLAAVIRGDADAELLDTYETERIAFARRLVATTDRAFEIATKSGPLAAFIRTRLFPLAVSILFRSRAARRYLFRTVSQIMINYRDSPLSAGSAGSVRGGDRLPWVAPEEVGDGDNYQPLMSRRWQVHVYGEMPPGVRDACDQLRLETHCFDWRPAMARAGFARNGLYLVRPDGYVALADVEAAAPRLREYVLKHRRL